MKGSRMYPKAAYIVQGIDQALNITTMPKLRAPYILLEKRAIGVIVGWITIHPLVEHDSVEREPPIFRGRMIYMAIAFAGIVQWADCLLICVQVVLSISWIIAKSLGYRGRKQEIDERHGSKRQVPQVGKEEEGPREGGETRDW